MEPVALLQCERVFPFFQIKTADSRSPFSHGIVLAVDPAFKLPDARGKSEDIPGGLRQTEVIFKTAQQTDFIVPVELSAEISCLSDPFREPVLSFETVKIRRSALQNKRRGDKRKRRRQSRPQNKRKKPCHKKFSLLG